MLPTKIEEMEYIVNKNNQYKPHLIMSIDKDSIAEEVGIEPGDILLSINDKKILDVFDYRYLLADEEIEVLIQKENGEEWLIDIEKDMGEDLGLNFKSDLMDELIRCHNQCQFCFIDQLPPHMRQTVYFKDDDWRMSFLHGNYITLTNMSKEDMDRLIHYHLSPINISIHATDPKVRIALLNNRFAGDIVEKIKYFVDAGIQVNGQIVLCKGINDGTILERTIKDLSQFIPHILSLTVVPVGLSKYRQGLAQLEPFEKEDARTVIETVHHWQQFYLDKMNTRFIFAADEFYVTAKHKLPSYTEYEDFPVLENGVGMLAKFEKEFEKEFKNIKYTDRNIHLSIATGVIATEFIEDKIKKLKTKLPNIKVHIYPIDNNFFGNRVTVTGLLVGQDLIKQLKNKELGDTLLVSETMLKDDEDVLLDDVSVEDISFALNIPVTIVKNNGGEFIKSILKIKE